MAGDWIKMECSTPDKPEVLAITVKMGWDDPDLTVGKLFKLWRWFDQHTTDGNAHGVTSALLDRYFGVSGFVAAVASVGWLLVSESGVSLPNFDKHNGATAKQRSQTAKRVANYKSNAKGNAATVTEALPREEKRREEEIPSLSPAKLPTCPTQQIISAYHDALPELPSVKVESDARKKALKKFWLFVLTSKKTDGSPRATTSENAMEWIAAYFQRVRDNAFLMGKIGRVGQLSNWQCDLDYLLTDKGITQVIEKTREAA